MLAPRGLPPPENNDCVSGIDVVRVNLIGKLSMRAECSWYSLLLASQSVSIASFAMPRQVHRVKICLQLARWLFAALNEYLFVAVCRGLQGKQQRRHERHRQQRLAAHPGGQQAQSAPSLGSVRRRQLTCDKSSICKYHDIVFFAAGCLLIEVTDLTL